MTRETNRLADHSSVMGRQSLPTRSPEELREMALSSADPIIRDALEALARFIEEDDTPSKEIPWSVRH